MFVANRTITINMLYDFRKINYLSIFTQFTSKEDCVGNQRKVFVLNF